MFAIEFGTDLDGTQDFFQLFWPIVLSHRIDEASPLWSVSPTDLVTEKFEIILTMEGTTPETGNNIQVEDEHDSLDADACFLIPDILPLIPEIFKTPRSDMATNCYCLCYASHCLHS